MKNNKYRTLYLVIEGNIEGKRGPSSRTNSWLQQWMSMASVELFPAPVDRTKWTHVIFNIIRR